MPMTPARPQQGQQQGQQAASVSATVASAAPLTAVAAAALAHRLAASLHISGGTASVAAVPTEGRRHGPQPALSSDTDEADVADSSVSPVTLKSLLIGPTPDSHSRLGVFLKERLDADGGETVLEIGIEDDGSSMQMSPDEFNAAFERIRVCANRLDADAVVVYRRGAVSLRVSPSDAVVADAAVADPDADLAAAILVGNNASTTAASVTDLVPTTHAGSLTGPCFGHVLIRQRAGKVEDVIELRICVVGNVDAGKSTLLGVLTKDTLDDGRGKARVNLFRHKHEIESGRTSSIGMEIMGFDSLGRIITPSKLNKPRLNWDDICYSASKVITFLDLAGHEKYLKTTVFGMTGCSPDYVMLMVGANAGVIGMTKEHLGLALALQVPVFIVVTKVDMCPRNILDNTMNQLVKILKSPGCRKIPMFIDSVSDVMTTCAHFVSERVCPIFQVSNVSGQGLNLLKLFLNMLNANANNKYDVDAPVEYQVTDTFSVPGVGTVVSGTVVSGIVHVGDALLLGPDSLGHFVPTIIKSIQRKRVNSPCAAAGQSASFGLKKVKRSALRKGMVMLSKTTHPKAVMEFDAEILVLYHSTTIGEKYQAMVHCGGVRQTARIVGMVDQRVLRTGDRAVVRFRFLTHPEFVKVGSRLLFREGRAKGIGKVVQLVGVDDGSGYGSGSGSGSGSGVGSHHSVMTFSHSSLHAVTGSVPTTTSSSSSSLLLNSGDVGSIGGGGASTSHGHGIQHSLRVQ